MQTPLFDKWPEIHVNWLLADLGMCVYIFRSAAQALAEPIKLAWLAETTFDAKKKLNF